MSYTVYDSRALVLDSWPYKDASRRLLTYSKQLGRILVRAQAVRKLASKLAPATQLYAESQLEKPAGDLSVHVHTRTFIYHPELVGRLYSGQRIY
jgi:recombinational DNA repair protein (RecF pathway)